MACGSNDGFAKKKIQKSEFTMEVGGLVQVSPGIFLCGKSSQNCYKPVLIFWSIRGVFGVNVYSVYKYIHC